MSDSANFEPGMKDLSAVKKESFQRHKGLLPEVQNNLLSTFLCFFYLFIVLGRASLC